MGTPEQEGGSLKMSKEGVMKGSGGNKIRDTAEASEHTASRQETGPSGQSLLLLHRAGPNFCLSVCLSLHTHTLTLSLLPPISIKY